MRPSRSSEAIATRRPPTGVETSSRHSAMPSHRPAAGVPVARALLATLLALAPAACGTRESRRPPTPSRSAATHPHATDRLNRLYRQQLTDANPFPAEQAIACERLRIQAFLGNEEGRARADAVLDTVFRTPADRAAHERAQGRLKNAVVYLGGEVCDSLDAMAERELPFSATPPRDSAARRR
jgi:hypothetical protein